jgi:GntR family transcriptional regulator
MESYAQFNFQIQPTSGIPIYRQIMDQVKIQVARGRMLPGTFVPSVRQVAADLQVNPMTVSKAYSLLEKEGALELVRGQGMRIKPVGGGQAFEESREQQITPLLEAVVNKSKQLSMGIDQVVDILRKIEGGAHES